MGLAAAEQGRYAAFHHAMFAAGAVNPATIEAAARTGAPIALGTIGIGGFSLRQIFKRWKSVKDDTSNMLALEGELVAMPPRAPDRAQL